MIRTIMMAIVAILLAGCNDDHHYEQAICVLVDVSGTYADQKASVVEIVKKGILPGMLPGDTMILMRIDSQSYENDNVEAKVALDNRPSLMNAQKLGFAKELDRFAAGGGNSQFTDIRGAMMLASEYLRETGAGTQTIVIFSDLEEELPVGVRRTWSEAELNGIRVVAVNVKKLLGDTVDPTVYRKRITAWEERVLASGARDWHVVVDGTKLIEYVNKRI